MAIDEDMHAAIEAVYAAAMDESLWPGALKKLTDLTGSQAATFWALDGSGEPRLPTFVYVNLDPRFIDEYLRHMVPQDPTVQYLIAHPTSAIVHDGLVITEKEKDRHSYYDWHQRYSDTRFRLVNQISPAPKVQAGITFLRARQAGRYELKDIEQFAALHRHIERALAVGFKLGSLGAWRECTVQMLDSNPAAILLMDEQQRLIYCNRSAEQLGAAGDGVCLSAKGIALVRKQDNDRLQALIGQALSIQTKGSLHTDGKMRAPRPSGKPPYSILVTPVSRNYPSLASLRPAVCIVISAAGEPSALDSRALRAAFDLTEAEARLALLLAAGDDLRSAAEKLHVGYGTARVRLSEIFRKTDTNRQAELIRLLLTTNK